MNDTIKAFVEARGITEVLHFTTNNGLVGVFAQGALLSRDALSVEERLESVRLLNCTIRKDPDWTDHVSLSITAVNSEFLRYSRKWHPTSEELWWAVLSFSPRILSDPGVVFTTTNNTYEAVVQRGEGHSGLSKLYEPTVPYGYFGSVAKRTPTTPENQPTHLQAEVLYPRPVDLVDLQSIYVPEDDHIDDVKGLMASIRNSPRVPVKVRPEVFL